MEIVLIASEGTCLRIYPLSARYRITSHLGAGDVRYLTTDGDRAGWLGVHLDCEPSPRRIDEIAAEHCRLLSDAQPAVAA